MAQGKWVALLLLAAGLSYARPTATLPVYIEDSHAGTFYWLIQNLDLTADYQLVLIDAHSDASEIFDSDAVRQKLLESAGGNQLNVLVPEWRARGVIQCFNWIEPLLPRPITKVWWIPSDALSPSQLVAKRREVGAQINAHEMARPRNAGDLSNRFHVAGWNDFTRVRIDAPVVVSIDLDYFAQRGDVQKVLDHVLKLPQLEALTFAISRPYLASEQQSHLLLGEALRYVARIVNADIHFEPFANTGEDRSQRSKQFYSKQMTVPRYDVEKAPPVLRTLILQNASRIAVAEEKPRWDALLERWKCDIRTPKLNLSDHEIRAGTPFTLRVDNPQPGTKIHWKVLTPAHATYNLTNIDQGFADGSARYVSYAETPVTTANELHDLDLLPYFDRKTGLGTVRVFSEVTDGNDTWLSNIVRLSRYQGEGYLGKLTEIFNLPYVYGSSLLNQDRQGADCSNFIIYGRRREGYKVPYVNPQGLLPYLELLDEFQGFQNGIAQGRNGPISVTPDLLHNGLLLHFGKHIAAIYSGVGLLNRSTPVVHQLEGYPEITTFDVMAKKYKTIRIMTFK